MSGAEPLVDAPALADVQRLIATRSPWLKDRPLAIGMDLWRAASEEHKQILEARGWSLAVDDELARQGVQHFLVLGVAVVVEGV